MTSVLGVYRHRFLHMVWQGFPEFFTTLSFADQRRVHDYYRPHLNLTDEQLVAHQARLRAEQPGLPSTAGRAFKKLDTVYQLTFKQAKGDPERWRAILNAHQHGITGSPDRRGRRLKVSVLARPDIDTKRIARALVQHANESTEALKPSD